MDRVKQDGDLDQRPKKSESVFVGNSQSNGSLLRFQMVGGKDV